MKLFGFVKDKLSRKNARASRTMSGLSAGSKDELASQRTAQGPSVQYNRDENPFAAAVPRTRQPCMFACAANCISSKSDMFITGHQSRTGASSTPSDEPPAYTPRSPDAQGSSPTTDDRFAFLSTFDTIFLVDDSGSMAGRSWRETAEAIRSIAPICTKHDADGIDIHFLNHPDNRGLYQNIKSPDTVSQIFSTVSPGGGTPTGTRLHQILKPYLQRYEASPATTKPLNIIVITDGVPSDDVESVIISAAKKLDRMDAPAWQVGIQFFQVGNETDAAAALQELDDGLAEVGDGIRDMVDTVPWNCGGRSQGGLTGEQILKIVLGAVNRRLDRQKVAPRS